MIGDSNGLIMYQGRAITPEQYQQETGIKTEVQPSGQVIVSQPAPVPAATPAASVQPAPIVFTPGKLSSGAEIQRAVKQDDGSIYYQSYLGNGEFNQGSSRNMSDSDRAALEAYVTAHPEQQFARRTADIQNESENSMFVRVVKPNGFMVNLDYPSVNTPDGLVDFKSKLAALPEGTAIMLNNNEYTAGMGYSYLGGIINDEGEFLQGFGAQTAGMRAIIDNSGSSASKFIDMSGSSKPTKPALVRTGLDTITPDIVDSTPDNGNGQGGAGRIAAINVGGFSLDAAENLVRGASAFGAPMAAGAIGTVKGFLDNRYYAGPDDKIGFADPLHAQDVYNTFAGGVGWLSDKTKSIGTGYYNWTVDTAKSLKEQSDTQGGWRKDANDFLYDNLARPVATTGDFAVNFLGNLNPLMVIGAVGMVGSGTALAYEGHKQPTSPTYALSGERHILGADIPYGDKKVTEGPIETSTENIKAGTTKVFENGANLNIDGEQITIPAGGSYTFNSDSVLTTSKQSVTTEQNVYHVAGVGERLSGMIQDPAALAASSVYLAAGGSGLAGVLRAGKKGITAADALEYSRIANKFDLENGGLNQYHYVDPFKSITKGNKPGDIGKDGYENLKGSSIEGPWNAASINNIQTKMVKGVVADSNGNVYGNPLKNVGGVDPTTTIIGIGKTGGQISGTVIKQGGAIFGGSEVLGKAGLVGPGEFKNGYSIISKEINLPANGFDHRGEINLPGYLDINKNKNKNSDEFKSMFINKYGFNPGNAYNYSNKNKLNNVFGNGNKNNTVDAFKFNDEGAFNFKYGEGYGFKFKNGSGARGKMGLSIPMFPGLGTGGGGFGKFLRVSSKRQKYNTGDITSLLYGKKKKRSKRRS